MKKYLFWIFLLVTAFQVARSQNEAPPKFVDATTLTLIGKALPTAHPYHRIDTAVYKGLSKSENIQARCSSGIAVVFRTNSSFIDLDPRYIWERRSDNMTGLASAGFDLYIKKDGKWTYANTAVPSKRDAVVRIAANMDTQTKECLLYLPLYSELKSLSIGVAAEADIQAAPNPFKRKTVFFGSSFTQGTSASRPGMSYPMQLERMLNLDVCNLGFAGNSKLQPYFADVLAAIQADAFVFDAFSNPNAQQITERLPAFLERLTKAHPNTPLIFVETIDRGRLSFDGKVQETEKAKRTAARKLMTSLMKRYANVYFIDNPLTAAEGHDTSADGIHPSDWGYYYWARNLSKELKGIFGKL
ncbi:SGNH/GDSL hydrolase family protein [Niabella terrae]